MAKTITVTMSYDEYQDELETARLDGKKELAHLIEPLCEIFASPLFSSMSSPNWQFRYQGTKEQLLRELRKILGYEVLG